MAYVEFACFPGLVAILLSNHVDQCREPANPSSNMDPMDMAAGVDPSKIRVVPQGVDTGFWDPTRFAPINLTTLKFSQATGPSAGPNSTLQGRSTANKSTKPYSECFLTSNRASNLPSMHLQTFCVSNSNVES